MKLLFDHNLSPRLVRNFADLYPNSQHVFLLEMDRDNDLKIWEYASQNDYTIVTRDSELCNRSDLAEIVALRGE
jgi:predicted nuclease of predicted toxin-antitoxin system